MLVFVCVCVRACVRACRACVRVRACVRACACLLFACVHLKSLDGDQARRQKHHLRLELAKILPAEEFGTVYERQLQQEVVKRLSAIDLFKPNALK